MRELEDETLTRGFMERGKKVEGDDGEIVIRGGVVLVVTEDWLSC